MKTQLRCFASFTLVLWFSAPAAIAHSYQSPELVESNELTAKVIELYKAARYDEALPLAKRALDLREKALSPTDPNLIAPLTNLGELERGLKQFGEARAYFGRALTISQNSYGENDVRVARLLDKLGVVAYENHQENDAENFFLRSIEVRDKTDADSAEEAQTIFRLA